ncbi:MAG: PASTA domain-containing protein [Tractidigestivibacter sp.]|jgi:beta-lactam-binding protein with PASTA domain|uniref:PASTA domain-containing protein n=1 Tax=Tractidigestivibacter sp. TaxID=2847320 RepID=UPI003D925FA0
MADSELEKNGAAEKGTPDEGADSAKRQAENTSEDPEATVLMEQSDADAPEGNPAEEGSEAASSASEGPADSDATVLMPSDSDATTTASDDEETSLINDEDLTHIITPEMAERAGGKHMSPIPTSDDDDMPTIVVPVSSPSSSEGPDGIDALDDPYAPVYNEADFTKPVAPVAIGSPVSEEGMNGGRVHIIGIVLVAVFIAAVAGFFIYQAYQNEYWGGKTVPNVIGKTETEALSTLSPLGFDVSTEEAESDEAVGTVIASDPEPGVRTDMSLHVTLTIAKARTIPTVTGLSVDDAKQALYDAGAKNISIKYQSSDETEGTVLSVDPGEGETFVSSDQITLTVAEPYTVPDVTGMTLEDAEQEIEDAGLTYTIAYDSETVVAKSKRNQVLSTDPEAGTEVKGGTTVTITMPEAKLTNYYYLTEYFDISPADLDAYLTKQGFSLTAGTTLSSGNAAAVYSNDSITIAITDNPEYETSSSITGSDNPLENGSQVGGVRLEAAASDLSSSVTISTTGLNAVMSLCNLSNLLSSCTDVSVQGDATIDSSADFICGYGTADGYTWVIVIGKTKSEATQVVVSVVPESYYEELDLSEFNDDIASYVASLSYPGTSSDNDTSSTSSDSTTSTTTSETSQGEKTSGN